LNRQQFQKSLEEQGYDLELGPPESQLMLDLAFEMIGDLERMRAELNDAPSTVAMSERGNVRADPRLAEIRAHTVALGKVLSSLFPRTSPSTVRARRAGQARQRAVA
jgi:hypothetical protein